MKSFLTAALLLAGMSAHANQPVATAKANSTVTGANVVATGIWCDQCGKNIHRSATTNVSGHLVPLIENDHNAQLDGTGSSSTDTKTPAGQE